MSVLECDRRGCDEIMCEHYSHEYGYLCNRCLIELIEVGPVDIDIWMNTTKKNDDPWLSDWSGHVRNKFETRY